MTREEAVNELNDRIKSAEYVDSDYIDCVSVDAVKMAISALSVPETNVGDTISRQAAIDALDQIFDRCEEIEAHLPEGDPDRTGYKMYPDYMTVWKFLHQLPSTQPERKTGRWEYVDYGGFGNWHCTACREICICNGDFDYCPNCGAKMDEGGDNETD